MSAVSNAAGTTPLAGFMSNAFAIGELRHQERHVHHVVQRVLTRVATRNDRSARSGRSSCQQNVR